MPSAIPPDDVTWDRTSSVGGYRFATCLLVVLPSYQRIIYTSLLCSYLVGVVGLGLLGRLLASVNGEYAAQQTSLMTAG